MVELRRHPDSRDAPDDVVGAARRVRQQNDSLASLQQRSKTLDGTGYRGHTVMNDAPQIENEPVIPQHHLADAADKLEFHGAPRFSGGRNACRCRQPSNLRFGLQLEWWRAAIVFLLATY